MVEVIFNMARKKSAQSSRSSSQRTAARRRANRRGVGGPNPSVKSTTPGSRSSKGSKPKRFGPHNDSAPDPNVKTKKPFNPFNLGARVDEAKKGKSPFG